MSLLPQVVRAALEFHHRHLAALAVADHGGGDLAARNERLAELDLGPLPDEQHLVELDRGARLGIQFLDAQHPVLGHAILLSTGGDHCVHKLESRVLTKGRAFY